MKRLWMKGNRADIVFGILPAVVLLQFFGVLGLAWDFLIALDALGKLLHGQLRSFDTSGLWSVLLAPLAWCGTAALVYAVSIDEQALGGLGRARRLLLGAVLLLSIAAAILDTAMLFGYPSNRANPICWVLAACAVSASIVAARQVRRLFSL